MDGKEKGFGSSPLKIHPSGIIIFPDINGYYTFTGIPENTYQLEVVGKYKDKFEPLPKFTVQNTDKNDFGLKLALPLDPEAILDLRIERSRCDEFTKPRMLFANTGLISIDSAIIHVKGDTLINIGKDSLGALTGHEVSYTYTKLAASDYLNIPLVLAHFDIVGSNLSL